MIYSMTGYGRAESRLGERRLVVEIRSLNSKQMDLNLRIAPELKDRETAIRQQTAARLERGKADMRIDLTDGHLTDTPPVSIVINRHAFRRHYEELLSLYRETGITPPDNLADTVLRFRDVLVEAEAEPLSDEAWATVQQTLNEAIEHFCAFRRQEGHALQQMFTEKLDAIASLLGEVEQYENGRVENIRKHLLLNLDKLAEQTKQAVDANRLEQEMIYYLEKLDITEEKVRLKNHIRYFRETMDNRSATEQEQSGIGVGKKLGFIAQEMGREINTLGSKSNQSDMQITVVKMKDLLEQIKEQVLNVL